MTVKYNEEHDRLTYDVMIDVDDVLMPWFETVDQHCISTWGYDGSRGPCNTWSMHEFYGRTREEWEDLVIAATSEGLYTHTDPFPGAVEAVNRLLWWGHRVHIVTARGFMANGENIRRWTGEWLERYGIGHTSLTFAKNKPRAMDELGVRFDYAIDDGVHNYEALLSRGVPAHLMTAPHNMDRYSERRVGSVWEFSQIVLGWSE